MGKHQVSSPDPLTSTSTMSATSRAAAIPSRTLSGIPGGPSPVADDLHSGTSGILGVNLSVSGREVQF